MKKKKRDTVMVRTGEEALNNVLFTDSYDRLASETGIRWMSNCSFRRSFKSNSFLNLASDTVCRTMVDKMWSKEEEETNVKRGIGSSRATNIRFY